MLGALKQHMGYMANEWPVELFLLTKKAMPENGRCIFDLSDDKAWKSKGANRRHVDDELIDWEEYHCSLRRYAAQASVFNRVHAIQDWMT
jgi:hypothetical protein